MAVVVSSLVAGCTYTPGGGGYTFDPSGTWTAVNDLNVSVDAEYLNAPSTGAYINGDVALADGESFFGPSSGPDSTPTVFAATSKVTVDYNFASNIAYTNISGTGGTSFSNSDFIAVPATSYSYSTVEVFPGDGTVQYYPFFYSTGCVYAYYVDLSLKFPSSSRMDGVISTRFELKNDFLRADFYNPTCDELFAAFQYDFDTNTESYSLDGLLMSLVYQTVDSFGYAASAVDYDNIINISALQFGAGFFANRYSTIIDTAPEKDRDSRQRMAEINGDYLNQLVANPNKVFAALSTDANKARVQRALAKVRELGQVDEDGRATNGISYPAIGDAVGNSAERASAHLVDHTARSGVQLPQ